MGAPRPQDVHDPATSGTHPVPRADLASGGMLIPHRTPSRLATLVASGALLVLPVALAAPPAHAAEPAAPVVAEDFDDGRVPTGWTVGPGSGTWTVENGRLVGRSANTSQLSTIAFGRRLEDFRFSATVRFESVVNASRWAALALDMPSSGAPPWSHAALRSTSTASNGVEFAQRTAANTWNVTDAGAAPTNAGVGKDVEVVIEVRGGRATWSFDGRQVLTTNRLPRTADGAFGLVANGAKVQFDDVEITPLAPESFVLPNDGTAIPKVVAHRGYSSVAPENTDVAMAVAGRTGADFVENDVAVNGDGEPWVLHDATVDRTTDGTGALRTLGNDYLRGLDAGSWFSTVFAGERLPSLVEQLAVVKQGTPRLLLEIKSPQTEAQVRTIIDRVRANGMAERTVIQSFSDDIVRWARAYAPSIPTMILRGTLDPDPVATAKALGVVSYNPSWNAIKGKPEVVDALNDAGIAVMPYTVDSAAEWSAMRDQGVDGIITNRAGELVGWNMRVAQDGDATPPAEPAEARILAPRDGVVLTRGDERSLALDLQHETGSTATLDGEPIEPGATIDPDELALGRHTVVVTAPGATGDPAKAEATFTVRATAAGVASLVATVDGLDAQDRTKLLREGLDGRWERFRKTLDAAEIPAATRRLLDGDAAVLQAAGDDRD